MGKSHKKTARSGDLRHNRELGRTRSLLPLPTSTASATETPPETPPARVAFISLGCPKNLVDSEAMLGSLGEAGCLLVPSDDHADAIVINTCGFLEASKEESLGVIRDAVQRKFRGELKRVVVAGCLVQRHRTKLAEWVPGIDAMLGVFDRDHIVQAVNGDPALDSEHPASAHDPAAAHRHDDHLAHDHHDHQPCTAGPIDLVKPVRARPQPANHARQNDATSHAGMPKYWIAANALQAAKDRGFATTGLTVNGKDGKGIGYFESDSVRLRLTPRHTAYLRVSEGCNQRCAFCTIPSIRGKMRSKPIPAILDEARMLMRDGAVELNLIGQDTTSYGYDIGYSRGLVGLLTELNHAVLDFTHASAAQASGSPLAWIRLMYVYPTHFTDEMIDAIARLDHVVKYIDIPLQHISDRILASMRRNISRDAQQKLIARLRDRIPGLAIRTTFITGYPGETDQDHHELLEFVKEARFDAMGVFRYSHEDGTPAGTLEDAPGLRVPEETKLQRERDLMLAQQQIAFARAKQMAHASQLIHVLVDGLADSSRQPQLPGNKHAKVHLGRAYFQAPQVDAVTYVLATKSLRPGSLVNCTVIGSDGYDLIARSL